MTARTEPWLRRGPLWTPLLRLLSLLYRLGWACLRLAHGRQPLVLPRPVLSVGNLSVGGTGKSMVARALAGRAARRGLGPALLLRGYGSASGPRPLLVSRGQGPLVGPEASGDEAAEHASGRGWAVWIGPDRAAAASEAVAQGANCLVLDDGFQRRWQLARNLDLLLVDFGQVQAGEALLPAGPFREPWSQAALADAVLVSGAPKGMDAKALRAALPGAWTQGAVFRLDRRPTGLQTWPGGGRLPLALLRKAPVLALSGLGQPRHFEDTLRDLGAQVRPWRFPDHHRFSLAELQAPPGDAGLVVTTVKDAVRLPASWKPRARVCVLQAEALVTPAAPFWRLVDAALKGGTAQRT